MKCIFDQNHGFCWFELRTAVMVHRKRHFPLPFCHSSGLLPFSITLLAQEELQIFQQAFRNHCEATQGIPSERESLDFTSLLLLMLTETRHTDSKKDQKPIATSPMCHHNCAVRFQGTSAQCHHRDSLTCSPLQEILLRKALTTPTF